MRSRFAAPLVLLATVGVAGPVAAHPCDEPPSMAGPDTVGSNDGRCGTVASYGADSQGRTVTGTCSYRTRVSNGVATVILTGGSVAVRVLPSDEAPAERLVPVSLTTRCLLRTASGTVILDVLSGSIGSPVDAQRTAATFAPDPGLLAVCVEATAVYGDFDAVWTPLACIEP